MVGVFAMRRPGQFRPAAEVKLGVDVMQVHLHRAFGYVQPLRDGLVAQPARNEIGDLGLPPGQPGHWLRLRSGHQELLDDLVVDPFLTARHRIHAFDEIAVADAVQKQAVDVERLYFLDIEPAGWLHDEDDAESAAAGLQPGGKT